MSGTSIMGTYVLYGKMGVCLVENQKWIALGRERNLYYVLSPISDNRSSVYVPCDNAVLVARMLPLLKREEIDALLSMADAEKIIWPDDRSERSVLYRSILSEGDRFRLVRMLCCLLRKKQERLEAGKHLSSMDEAALQECMRLINEEFSMVLDIPSEAVLDYILEHL